MVNSLFNGWRFEDAWLGHSCRIPNFSGRGAVSPVNVSRSSALFRSRWPAPPGPCPISGPILSVSPERDVRSPFGILSTDFGLHVLIAPWVARERIVAPVNRPSRPRSLLMWSQKQIENLAERGKPHADEFDLGPEPNSLRCVRKAKWPGSGSALGHDEPSHRNSRTTAF
jgi:hypothetical protein